MNDLQSTDQLRIQAALQRIAIITSEGDVRAFLYAGLLPRVLQLAFTGEADLIKDRAYMVLTNLASVEGDLGARAIWEATPDAPDHFENALFFESNHISSSLMWCLANIASSAEEFAHAMIEKDFQSACMTMLQNQHIPGSLRKNAGFLLSNLSPYMDVEDAREILSEIGLIPPQIFLESNTLFDLLWVIHRLYRKTRDLCGVGISIFVSDLESPNAKIVNPALLTISDICSGDDKPLIQNLLKANVVMLLHSLLVRSIQVPNVLFALSNIAVEPYGSKVIVETPGLLLDVARRIRTQGEALWVLTNLISRGGHAVVAAFIRCGAGLAFLRVLNTANPTGKRLCLEGLMALLQKGGATAYALLHTHGLRESCERFLTDDDPEIIHIATSICALASSFHLEDMSPPLRVVPAAFADYIPTQSATLAAARMTTMLSRGVPAEPVPVEDLVFTAGDVSYLLRQGYTFQGGNLVA